MATYGKKLLDSEGNIILPKTRSSLVYMDDNETLENTIKKILSGETTVGKAIDCSSAGNLRMYNTETDQTSYVGLSSEDSAGNLCFFWDSTNSKTVLVQGYDNTARTTANNAMPKTGGTFSNNVSSSSVIVINSTGNEASIRYNRSSDGNNGWALGEGCANAGKKFCLFSFASGVNIIEVDPSTNSIHSADTNRATWCLRNSIVTNSGWAAVASNALWFIRG